jgi:hypothetical protein
MTLELPICNFDAKTGLLCAICQAKVVSGRVSEADVQVSKALIAASGKFKELNSISFVRAHRVDGGDNHYLVEVTEPGLAVLREREVRAELERHLGGRVWVAGSSGSSRRLIEDILQPLRVAGFSTIWLPDGSTQTRVTVEGAGGGSMRRLETVRKILKASRGIDLVIEIDDVPNDKRDWRQRRRPPQPWAHGREYDDSERRGQRHGEVMVAR